MICLGKSIVLCDFFVKLHETQSLFLIKGQYVHLPNLLSVSSEVLAMGMGVSQPLGGSEVTLIRDMASRKSVWLTVVEGALIVRIPRNITSCYCKLGK